MEISYIYIDIYVHIYIYIKNVSKNWIHQSIWKKPTWKYKWTLNIGQYIKYE